MAVLGIMTTRVVSVMALLSCVAYVYVVRWVNDRRIRRLGQRAPLYKARLPLALDLPYDAVMSAKNNTVVDFWQKMFDQTGCSVTRSLTCEWRMLVDIRLIFTADAENIKALLTGQFADFGKGEQFHSEWQAFLGDSIFTTDGKQWHDSRQLIRPMFMRERVADLNILEEHCSKLIKLMGSGDGSMIRLDNLLSRFTLDAATHFLFGISAGSLDDETVKFGSAFNEVQRVQSLLVRAGPMRHLIPQSSYHAGIRTMEGFIEPLITSVLEMSPSELEERVAKSDTFIHALARFTRDRKVIRDQLVSLLLAGRDTTAATLSWTFLELARNPKVVEKLRAEIANVIGTEGQRPTYENIKDMKYLTHIINETLRFYPPVPLNVRASLKDTTLPRGGGPNGLEPLAVPAGTMVGYGTIHMHRNRDLYPPISDSFPYDPMVWQPDRWATWQPKAWNFVPFNGGPRICIGQQFAMVEMAYTIIRVFQRFDKIIDYGNKDTMKIEILLTPAEGVKVGFVNNASSNEKS